MMLKKALLPALLALTLGGCINVGGGGSLPDQLLTLTPEQTAAVGATAAGQAATALIVLEPRTDQRLNVTGVPVQVDASSVAYLKDAVWVERPSRQFRNLLSETIRAKGARLVVNEGDLGYPGATKLSGQLLDMGYDAATGSVVVRFDAVLQKVDGEVSTRRFESRVPGIPADVASVAPALNQAANQVAREVAEWVG